MLIRLIAPEYKNFAGLKDVYNQQKLSLIYLASLTPSEHTVEIFDEDLKPVVIDDKPDIVGITVNCHTYKRSIDIAKKYKTLGKTVVFGGFQASLYPDDMKEYADAIVVGEAEYVWEELLTDHKNNRLKKIYKSDRLHDLKNLPIPKYDYYNPMDFYNQYTLFVTRGCPFNCNYCCIKAVYGSSFRKRPVDEVVAHIEFIKNKYSKPSPFPLTFCFVDDNIWGDLKYAKELFEKLTPLKISWFTQGASVSFSDETLELASKSGCILSFIGLESLENENLKHLKKKQNDIKSYEEYINRIHSHNIAVGAYFMVGLPYDKENVFDELLKFFERNLIELPAVHIYTPVKGSEEFETGVWENKEIHKNDFDALYNDIPVYYPKSLSKKDFKKKYLDFMRKLFSNESIENRLKECKNVSYKYLNLNNQRFYNAPEWDKWVVR